MSTGACRELAGWGAWPRRTCRIGTPADPETAARALPDGSVIARGLGRGYGDCALNAECTLSSARLDRLLAFDPATGVLEAEAGVSLARIIELLLPRGFFPAVTPGTKFVTLGGAIAADVHGKNHHVAGSFGDHVLWLDLLGPDGSVTRCSAEEEPALFDATVGGMGLTGIILRAAMRLMPVETAWVRHRTVVAPDLDAAIAAFEDNLAATYSVAWIDCLARGPARGRSLVYFGEHARPDELPDVLPDGLPDGLPAAAARARFEVPRRRRLRVPVDAPSWALGPLTVRAFNTAYFRAGSRRPESALVDWDRYFYPLDALAGWNRIYGRRGFAQYQCALPLGAAREALVAQLDAVAQAGQGSFLAVLKRLGPGAGRRPLSFPIEGYTLALDFPLTAEALTLMDRLDDITRAAGGRLYLAKDSRMTQRTFEAGYPRAGEIAALAARRGGRTRFASLQSQRLGL